MAEYLLGIDLGGTKIEGVILQKDTLEVLYRERVKTESDKGYDHILNTIKLLVSDLSVKSGVQFNQVGIGTPGTLDPKLNVMKNCNSTVLNGKPFLEDLQHTLDMKVMLSNDANCFAIAETMLGVIKDQPNNIQNVFGVIMGTGVGGGVIVNGKIVGGLQGIGGEWGHNVLEENGDLCYCGKNGCVEQVISGPALERYYQSKSGIYKPLQQIVTAYRERNDPFADKTMQRLFKNFGKAISVVINFLDPEAIVIGGGLGNIDELYTEGVEEVKKHVFNVRLDTQFFKPKLGDSAGVFGAALL